MLTLTIWILLHTRMANTFWQALIWLAAFMQFLGLEIHMYLSVCLWKQSCVYKISGCYDDRFWETNPWICQCLPGSWHAIFKSCFVWYTFPHSRFLLFFFLSFSYLHIQSWTVLQLNEFILHLSIIMVSSISDKPAPKPFVKKQTMISRFTCHPSSLVVSSRWQTTAKIRN